MKKAWSTVILLIGSTALYGHKAVPSLVSASHLIRRGVEVEETRVHLMRDHTLYIEEIAQVSSSQPTCKMSRAVLPEPAFQRIEKVMSAAEFRAIPDRERSVEIKPEQDEAWHVAFHDGPTRFFTFNAPQSPPLTFVTWFDDARRVKPNENVPLRVDSYRCTLFSQEMARAWEQ